MNNKFKYYKFTIEFLKILSILIVAHLTHSAYDFNRAIVLLGAIISISLFYIFTNQGKNKFLTFIFLLALAHFGSFLPKAGGLFVYFVFFLLIFSYRSFVDIKIFSRKLPTQYYLVSTIFVLHIIAILFKSPVPIYMRLLGTLSLLGYLYAFILSSNLYLKKSDIKLVINILSILQVLNLLVSINTTYQIIDINSPLFISSERRYDLGVKLVGGIFVSSELSGEFGLLIFILFSGLLISKYGNYKSLSVNGFIFFMGFVASILNCILSFSKAIFIFLPISFFTLIFFMQMRGILVFINKKVIYLIVIVIFTISFSTKFLDFDFIFQRFAKNPQIIKNFLINPLSGEGTSRETAYSLGIERLKSSPWIIGYGWSVGDGNRYAWFGDLDYYWWRADHHNLYLCLIPIFGWIGTGLFLFLIFTIMHKTSKSRYNKSLNNKYLNAISTSLLILLLFFLIDEYKINATRSPHYFLLVWLLLGFTNSIYITLKRNFIDEKTTYSK